MNTLLCRGVQDLHVTRILVLQYRNSVYNRFFLNIVKTLSGEISKLYLFAADNSSYGNVQYSRQQQNRHWRSFTLRKAAFRLLVFDQVVLYPLRRAPFVENDALTPEIVQTAFLALVQRRLSAAVPSARINCTRTAQ